MNRFPRACAALVIAALAVLGLQVNPATAADLPTGALRSVGLLNKAVHAQYNEYGGGDSWNWADSDIVATYKAPDGVGVVRYSSSGGPKLVVDVYDTATQAQVGSSRTIVLDSTFPIWGGFHAGADGHFYVLTGRENPKQSLTQSVMAVQRFSPSWASEGTAYIAGRGGSGKEGIYVPFDAAAADMTMVGSRLVVHTGRTMFGSDVHHQADFTFEVDTTKMTATPFTDLGDGPYSSHSFNQLVTTWNDSLVLVDHGDAYPRGIQMTVMADYPTKRDRKDYLIKAIPGAVGDNTTGTSITGIGSGPSGVLVVGNAVRLSGKTVDNDEARNVFVLATNPSTGATKVSQLTSFAPDGENFAFEPRIAKVGDDRFAVIFLTGIGDDLVTEYRLLDSTGKVLASKSFPGMAHASIDNPTLIGSQLFWVSTAPGSGAQAYLYGFDLTNPASPTIVGELPSFPSTPRPTISGQAALGQTLTADPGAYGTDGVTFAYQWAAGGKAVSGATGKTFAPTAAEVGKTLTVTVTATKTGYRPATSTSVATTAVTDPTAKGFPQTPRPVVTGSAVVGQQLTASPGDWGVEGVTFTYQWTAAGSPISGATSSTFTPGAAQVGQKVAVVVTATKVGYVTTQQTSVEGPKTALGTIVPGKPTISGRTQAGSTLTAKVGSWKPSGLTYRYQWYQDGKRIRGATAKTFRLTSKHVGHRLSVHVSGAKAGYTSAVGGSSRTAVVRK